MMTASYFLQIPDSVSPTHQLDTVASAGAVNAYTTTNEDESAAVGYFPDISAETAKLHIAKPTVVKPEDTGAAQPSASLGDVHRTEWNTSRNFFAENGLSGVVTGSKAQQQKAASVVYHSTQKPPEILPQPRNIQPHNWLTGIFLLLVILFVWIRIFYSKYFSILANALISFHTSAKLFQEKNVFLHRVSMVLDFIFLIVFSIFVFQLIGYFEILHSGFRGFKLYLLLLNLVMLYALLRILILRLTGSLFLVQPVFAEYIHNIFVVNKGMGIALFPLVIMVNFLPYKLVPVMLVTGMLIYAIAFILKSIRAYQIIIRKDVLLFYLIMYLCTLEILPLLLGYKFVKSLI